MEVKSCAIVVLSISLLAHFLILVYGGPVDLNAEHSNVSKGENTAYTMNIHSDLFFPQKEQFSAGKTHNMDQIVFPKYIEEQPPEFEMTKEPTLNFPPKNITIGNRVAVSSPYVHESTSFGHPKIEKPTESYFNPTDVIINGEG